MKRYFKITNSDKVTHLKVDIRYNLGNSDYRPSKRGYYAHVTPVKLVAERGYTTETTQCYSGFKTLLREVTRKSTKVEREIESNETLKALKSMIRDYLSTVEIEADLTTEVFPV